MGEEEEVHLKFNSSSSKKTFPSTLLLATTSVMSPLATTLLPAKSSTMKPLVAGPHLVATQHLHLVAHLREEG